MHEMKGREGPCGLPDGHAGRHRSLEGAARERERKRLYNRTPAGEARRQRWENAHPGIRAAIWIRDRMRRRAAS